MTEQTTEAAHNGLCIHVRVTITHAPPTGRWVCEECGAAFQPIDPARVRYPHGVIPPGLST